MSEFDQVFDRLRRLTETPARAVAPPVVSGEGATPDGWVSVRIEGGKVAAVRIDARAMRTSNAALADMVAEAVNAALAAHTKAVLEALSDASTPAGERQRELEDIRQQTRRAMADYLGTMQDLLSRVSQER